MRDKSRKLSHEEVEQAIRAYLQAGGRVYHFPAEVYLRPHEVRSVKGARGPSLPVLMDIAYQGD